MRIEITTRYILETKREQERERERSKTTIIHSNIILVLRMMIVRFILSKYKLETQSFFVVSPSRRASFLQNLLVSAFYILFSINFFSEVVVIKGSTFNTSSTWEA